MADSCPTIAARLLAEFATPLGRKTLVDTLGARSLWTSPVPTLSAAIRREIDTKGRGARFRKADKGLFTKNTTPLVATRPPTRPLPLAHVAPWRVLRIRRPGGIKRPTTP